MTKKKGRGRPTDYTEDLGNLICDLLADGKTLTEICKDDDMPHRVTVLRWCRKYPDFRIAYASARQDQQHIFGDIIIERSKDESRDYYVDDKGVRRSDNTAVQRDRLFCDNLKFLMARLASDTYGDKVRQEITGKDGEKFEPVLNITIEK